MQSACLVSCHHVIVRVWLRTQARQTVKVQTVLGKVLWYSALIVGVLGLLLELEEGQIHLPEDGFPEDLVDEAVGVGKVVLPQFGVNDFPVFECSHQLYKSKENKWVCLGSVGGSRNIFNCFHNKFDEYNRHKRSASEPPTQTPGIRLLFRRPQPIHCQTHLLFSLLHRTLPLTQLDNDHEISHFEEESQSQRLSDLLQDPSFLALLESKLQSMGLY